MEDQDNFEDVQMQYESHLNEEFSDDENDYDLTDDLDAALEENYSPEQEEILEQKFSANREEVLLMVHVS